MNKQSKLPPRSPRYRSIFRLQRFIQNPIPFLEDNFKKYGDTYMFSLRHSKTNILTTNPEVIKHIFRKNADNYEKPEVTSTVLSQFVGKGLLLARGEEHTKQRKIMSPSFSPNKIGELVDFMSDEIDTYLDELDKRLNQSPQIDILTEMRNMTFRVMLKAIYSDDMDDAKIKIFADRFTALQVFLVKIVRFPMLLRWFNIKGETRKYKKIADKNNQVILDIIAKRRNEAPKDDLLGGLMAAKYEDGTGMSDQKLQEETLVLIVAGHETASDILSWIFYLINQHPETIAKIKAEEKALLDGRDRLTFIELARMEYLTQVINECLRLYPPSWITDRIAKEDDEVAGFFIPKGARVMPFIYGIHRSEALWKNPTAFDPSRFSKEKRKELNNFSHIPFGAGPRMCIGRHFATTEMKLIVLKMLKRYEFDLVPNQKIEILPLVTLRPRYGIKFNLKNK